MASGRSAAWFSALAWGARGRPFESARPDHLLLTPSFELTFYPLLSIFIIVFQSGYRSIFILFSPFW